ncbi:hypothetical protein CMO93_04830 [Candidatus Woesearchaeota archaeon]|nr:hypothetical protein [Candidatus Woesearchaeota archaeon]|tara:strand:+ start:623 stop:2089 length:1467 start_codon:yes stop_codon:yes gene_type:complete
MIIRWVCEKDNKKWLYPVEKCIYCKGPITKQKGNDIKVIGITRVSIPSPMHPVIPYNVLLLEDEHGNRIPKKTMKNYKIGDEYKVEKAKTDEAVVITKIKYDIGEALEESLELLKSYDVGENDKVLIKPSIIEPAYPYQTVNTNPRLLNEIIVSLKKKGVKDIIIAEQAMIGNDVMAAAKKAGILEVCKKHSVLFIDLSKADCVEKNEEGFNFRIAKEVMERKIINVPVMKTNSQIGISGAVENMIRLADEGTQKRMFSEDIEKTLPKLLKVLPSFLTIGDATIGMHGQGPTLLGEPAFLNMILVSKDAVALDTVFSEMGMLKMPDYLKAAAEIGTGNDNTKNMEIVGDELEAIKFNLKPAKKGVSAHPNIKLVDGKANPYTFNTALKMTSKLVGMLGEEVNLVIGPIITKEMVVGKERLVVYGDDAIKRTNELGIEPLAEIPEDVDELEKVMLLKSILENPEKKKITVGDKLKSKMAKFGAKIKSNV